MATRTDPAEQDPRQSFWDQASHDLRQPVQALQLLAQVFARNADSEPVRQAADHMRRVVADLARMQDALVQLSRLECGRTVPESRPVDLRSVTGTVVRELAAAARERGAELRVTGIDGSAEADPEWLVLILRSMVLIALGESEGGEISITADGQGQGVCVSVAFVGSDVAETQANAIFVETGEGRTVPGPGYLAHLCRLLGYELELGAAGPGDQRFSVTLPRLPSPA